MSAFLAPAAALINVAVFADYEVISDVGPSFRGHVIVLEFPHFQLAYSLSVATGGSRVMNDNIRRWFSREIGRWRLRCSGTPLRSGNDLGSS